MLAAPVLSRYVTARLNQINNFSVDILPVINNFFGPSVTVAGLLTGQDILAQAINVDEYDLIVLPPRIINEDGVLLDDFYPYQIAETLQKPVQVWDGDFGKLVDEDNG
jgi:NifB/MoaA-like Fe-S oxidoreductase